MKILYAASEATPFAKSGGLADVAGSLPKALAAKGHDVRVFCPLYSAISEEMREKFYYIKNAYVRLGWRNQYCGIFRYESDGVTFYFIDNEYYFARGQVYGEYDDAERAARPRLEAGRHQLQRLADRSGPGLLQPDVRVPSVL